MERRLTILLVLLTIASAAVLIFCPAVSAAQPADVSASYAPGEILVKYKPGKSVNQKSLSAKVESVEEIDHKGLKKVKIPKDKDVLSAVAQLSADPNVEYAEPNYIRKSSFVPNDPAAALISNQGWYLKKIKAYDAWSITQGNPSVTVAVIDSGIDLNHPDFEGKIIHPYNSVYKSTLADDIMDYHGHGTHVAGLVGAAFGNGKGIAGVGGDVKVMPINAVHFGSFYDDDIVEGIYWAIDHGARVINLSLGGENHSQVLGDAVQLALDNNIVVVAAAGNDASNVPQYPAAYDGVIAVAAVDALDKPASFSNYGSWISVTAPGVNIYSTTLTNISWGYENKSGTSMSSPFVAGMAGLMLSVKPDLTPAQVLDNIRQGATDLNSPGFDLTTGWGLVNLHKTLQLITDTANPAVVSTVPSPGQSSASPSGHITIQFTEEIMTGQNFQDITVSGGSTPISFQKQVSGNVLIIDPQNILSLNTTYSVNIPAGAVTDLVGKPLTVNYTFSFTTSDSVDFFELPFAVTDALYDGKRSTVYIADRSGKKLHSVNLQSGVVSSITFSYMPERLEFGRGEYSEELYVALVHREHDPYWWIADQTGTIVVIDRDTFTEKESISVSIDPFDIVAGRDGHIYITSGSGQGTEIQSYNRSTKKLVHKARITHKSYAELHPTLERIYTVNTLSIPRGFTAYNISNGLFTDPNFFGGYNWPYHGDYWLETNLFLSPLGTHLYNGSGYIFSTTTDQAQDMMYAGNLGVQFSDIQFEPDASSIYVIPANAASVNVYDSLFNLKRTLDLVERGSRLFLYQGQLIAIVTPLVPSNTYKAGIQILGVANTAVTTVKSVSVPETGIVKPGQNLDLKVTFSDVVSVDTTGGFPYILLDIGSVSVKAEYLSGSGTNALVFRYTLQTGGNYSEGISAGSAITLNGGIIRDSRALNTSLALTDIGGITKLTVDEIAPTIVSVSPPANGSYNEGQNLDFTLNFSENVKVDMTGGVPSLPLTIGSTSENAVYLSGSGTKTLVFRYQIKAGDNDLNGITVGQAIQLNGGWIKDYAGNASELSFTNLSSTSLLAVDTTTSIVTVETNVIAGGSHTVLLKGDGTVWAWGYNSNGELGDGTTSSRSTPAQVSGLTGVIAVATDSAFTLALKEDGTVWAWGYNGSGQLGDGTTTSRSTPVQVSGLTNITAIASGYGHSLALKNDGTVWAWGQNYSGQLGNGTTSNQLNPVMVNNLTDVNTIMAGGYQSFAKKNDGAVWAWGKNTRSQLGDGTSMNRSTPVQATGLTDFIKIATSDDFTVGLKNDGTLWAWGDNYDGQLGLGDIFNRYFPTQISGMTGVSDITVGNAHSVALKNDGSVWVWGYNNYGQLGDGTTTKQRSPLHLTGLTGVRQIIAGSDSSFVLKTDGTMWAWGSNFGGKLGDGTTTQRDTPVKVDFDLISPNVNSVSVPAGGTYFPGQNLDFSVSFNEILDVNWTDGIPYIPLIVGSSQVQANYVGGSSSAVLNFRYIIQLGDSDLDGISVGTAIILNGGVIRDSFENNAVLTLNSIGLTSAILVDPNGRSVVGSARVAAGTEHTLVLKNDGTVWSWGSNYGDQLGDASVWGKKTPGQVSGLAGVMIVDAGSHYSVAVKNDGTVWTWGNNSSGQLGNGSTSHSMVPGQVPGLTSIASVTAGWGHTAALKSDGTVWIWGANGSGQLGDGTVFGRTIPVQVGGLTGIVSVSAGSYHTVALKSDGTVWAWGNNAYGQLGDGTTADKWTPIQVNGLTGITAVTAGDSHTLALKNDGTLWVWGNNAKGQLGDGTTSNRTAPFQLTNLTNVSAISAGGAHSIILKNDGTVWSWGDNWAGQLGFGNNLNRTSPAQVSGLTAVIAIGTGSSHSTALKNDGTVWSWGYNYSGQLGDGTFDDRSTPVMVNLETIILGVASISVPPNGIYFPGRVIELIVSFSDNVTVNTVGGIPYISLTIGNKTVQAQYVAGSGSSVLSFSYTIQPGDNDPDGITIASAIELKGATIRDSFSRDAVTNLPNSTLSTGVIVSSLIGDFTGDGSINFEDLMIFALTWGHKSTDPGWSIPIVGAVGSPFFSGDIGPAPGTLPNLVVSPDGKVDSQDLAIFTQVWNWAND